CCADDRRGRVGVSFVELSAWNRNGDYGVGGRSGAGARRRREARSCANCAGLAGYDINETSMATIHPDAVAHHRKRWLRHDAYRFAALGTPEADPGLLHP